MIKKVIKHSLWALPLFIACFSLASYFYIEKQAESKIYTDVTKIPKRDIGLLLGTAPTLRNGHNNRYFYYRTKACIELYKAGKIKHVLISGDNGRKEYNEPEEMMKELIKGGIPKNKITLDFAGFRTLDSVIRAKKVFGVTSLIFISQKFHNQRAIFLSETKGIDALGFNAQDVTKKYGVKTQIREYFARTKAVIDVVTFKSPKFLGKEEFIKI